MEEIIQKIKENEPLILEAEKYVILDNKGIEIAKDRIRFLKMLIASIEPIRDQANKTHKITTSYISQMKKAIDGYNEAIGNRIREMKALAKKQEQEINAILGSEELPVLVNADIPADIKIREDFDVEITDPIVVLKEILENYRLLDIVEFKLGIIKRLIKAGIEIRGIKIITKESYRVK